MPLYVFECSEHGRVERLCPAGQAKAVCAHCALLMPRVYGYSVAITQPEPDTRGMFRRFTEASAELDHKGVDGSSLWKQAQRTAGAMIAAGENPHERTS